MRILKVKNRMTEKEISLKIPYEMDKEILEIEKLGWSIEFVDFCEDAETPGILGMYAGVCCKERKVVKIRTKDMSRKKIVASLQHERDHILGKEKGRDFPELGLYCGGTINEFLFGRENG